MTTRTIVKYGTLEANWVPSVDLGLTEEAGDILAGLRLKEDTAERIANPITNENVHYGTSQLSPA
jgi:hypothetical protein